MYEPDPRTPADRICDEAPPMSAAVRREISKAVCTARPDGLLSALLTTGGEFTAAAAAERHGCWESSIRTTIRNHPDLFVKVTARRGSSPAVWRAKRTGERP